MELFGVIFFSFPVIIFSTLLTLCILYWLIAACGLLSIDCLDINLDADIDGFNSDLPANGLGGLLMKWGFNEVPMTLIITLISLLGWGFSYTISRYILINFYDISIVYYVGGAISFVVVLFIATYLTAIIIKPIRPLFYKLNSISTHKILLGKIVEIRSSVVTQNKGDAICEDGGAGLILQVRCDDENQFKRGDHAVLLSYNEVDNSYNIMSIEEFNEQ